MKSGGIIGGFLCCLLLGLAGCEPDLAEVDRIASIRAEEPVDISKGVTVIFSDSAQVKAKMTAPEMRTYTSIANPYHEFQKGIKIVFYDPAGEEIQNIVADYAIQKEVEEIVEFRHNVVITRSDGVQIKTDELIHDERKNIFYNNAPVFGYSRDGRNTFQGSSFRSEMGFNNIMIQNSTGQLFLD